MASSRERGTGPRVPGFASRSGNAADSREGQQALRLHAGIAVVAAVLCAFVTVVFFVLGAWVTGVVFAVVTVACLGVLGWALRRQRR